MNFEDFQLPPLLIRDLYRNTLTDATVDNGSAKPEQQIQDFVLGDNQKRILILIDEAGNPMISDQELQFLNGILSACKLTVRDVAILNIAHIGDIQYEKLFGFFSPLIMLMFGVKPVDIDMPVNFPENHIYNFQKIRIIAAPSLSAIENNKTLKKNLWNSLKQIFI